jgi:hypothetical protein
MLRPENGEILWAINTPYNRRPTAICDADLLLVEERSEQFMGVVCRDLTRGEPVWEKDFSDAPANELPGCTPIVSEVCRP